MKTITHAFALFGLFSTNMLLLSTASNASINTHDNKNYSGPNNAMPTRKTGEKIAVLDGSHEIFTFSTYAQPDSTKNTSNNSKTSKENRNQEKDALSKQKSVYTNSAKIASEAPTIVVTGSNIRGSPPAGSQLDVISQEEIQQSGYATVQQFMQTYVKNFSGGASEDTIDTNSEGNITESSGLNLRGLGNSATLVLVNGRRLPIAGADTSFADISSIPASIIERIEVLTDGGSAIYGTDAIAGVVNVILRKDYEGAETRARFGTVTKGSLEEYNIGQTFGGQWPSGSALISYEYYRRTPLENQDRENLFTSDHRSRGGTDRRLIYANPGNILDPLTFIPLYAIPRNQNGHNLSQADLDPTSTNLSSPALIGQALGLQNKHSIFAYAEQDLAENIEIFAESRFGHRNFRQNTGIKPTVLVVPSSNAFFVDPFGESDVIFVSYDLSEDLGPDASKGNVDVYSGSAGSSIFISDRIQARMWASLTKENTKRTQLTWIDEVALAELIASDDPNIAFNPFGDGSHTNKRTLDAIKTRGSDKTKSKLFNANIVIDGDLMEIEEENIKFAVGADYQNIDYNLVSDYPNRDKFELSLEREVWALFGEIRVPLLSRDNSSLGLGKLEFSGAIRYDNYSDVGSTTNPKLGLSWSPIFNVNLRATWGRSFRAPNLYYLTDKLNYITSFPISDPRDPSQNLIILYETPGNPELKNEKSKNYTFGLSFQLLGEEGPYITVDYFNIKFKDRIRLLNTVELIFTQPDMYGHLAILNPTPQQVAEFCGRPVMKRQDPMLCENPELVSALVDGRYQNFSTTSISGIDVTISHGIILPDENQISADLNASYMFKYKERLTAGQEAKEQVDTLGYPVDFRARATLSWSRQKQFNASLIANYTDSYRDKLNEPFLKVGSLWTFDVALSVKLGRIDMFPVFSEANLSFNVINIFNNLPPFVNGSTLAYDPNNADPLGRFFSVSLTKSW